MEKEFVPYEEALAMKELGFDELCVGIYHDNGQKGSFTFGMFQFEKRNSQANTISGTFIGKDGCYAPLYQQAFRWFREKGYNFNFNSVTINENGNHIDYYFCIDKNGDYLYRLDHRDGLETYEEAQLACLRKLIEILEESL